MSAVSIGALAFDLAPNPDARKTGARRFALR
jgi:hypothetical protein